MTNDQIETLEEQLAQLQRTCDELSDVVAGQGRELQNATRRIAMLMAREAERELDTGGTVPLADDPPPPHW